MAPQVLEMLSQAFPDSQTFDGIVVDGTVGGGGHAALMAERLGPGGRLVGFDRDPRAVQAAREALKEDRAIAIFHNSYAEIERCLEQESVSAVLLDLGLCTDQILSERGFSFSRESLLDMRYDPSSGATAYDVVNHYSIERLREVFFKYGEEPLAPRIARRIAERRLGGSLKTTTELAQVVKEAVPARFEIKALARIFQAIRIEVNGEIEHLERGIEACWRTLRIGGVFCIISYHSLEDRRVKRFFAAQAKGCICPPRFPICICRRKPSAKILTSSALRPSPPEIRMNPASRSARLRAARKLLSGRELPSGQGSGGAEAVAQE
jgi:16S rRNA (cytosine1402-N4)-methyltransferase